MASVRKVLIEVSARHVHLSRQHADALFGKGYELKAAKGISQPGQFAAKESVTVVGPKGQLTCRVVGPERSETQVELAVTECKKLGLPVAMRVSGNLKGTAGGMLLGPKGQVTLKQGVIVAQRHLHVSPKEAKALGVTHGDVISVKTFGTRPVTFHGVAVRSREGTDKLSFMLDTDEANAAGLRGGEKGEIV